MKQLATVLLLFLVGAACGGKTTESPKPDMHTAQLSLDWAGTYAGLLPCADCEGIATRLTLGKDLRFTLSTQYLGKSATINEQQGHFTWNEAGNTIRLSGLSHQATQFFVGEEHLVQLDLEGNRVTGDLAQHYILKKSTPIQESLLDVDWEVRTIEGVRITASNEPNKRANILRLSGERITFYAGCNNFTGKFSLNESSIRISPMISTKMACPDMKTEDDLARAIIQVSQVFNYGNTLLFIDSKGRVKATFEKYKRSPVLK